VKEAEPELWIKIGDFGISKRARAADSTAFMTQIGTWAYMAPEVSGIYENEGSESSEYTDKVDLWSLGCVIHEILVGGAPFHKSAGQLVQYCAGKKDLLEESFWSRSLSKEGSEFITHLLTPNPAKRPDATMALKHVWLHDQEVGLLMLFHQISQVFLAYTTFNLTSLMMIRT